ncbi:hypothetical protein CEXT_688551 [Caerostris extrusa]|uniref:Uncharacterized protein n=1 Tax=Caerostris extrusa TaxID=172846 RepID=A0AAV4QZH4_CAEEX|nr:hypothetical protein CEXT_688551 [Caerostris extrusa]
MACRDGIPVVIAEIYLGELLFPICWLSSFVCEYTGRNCVVKLGKDIQEMQVMSVGNPDYNLNWQTYKSRSVDFVRRITMRAEIKLIRPLHVMSDSRPIGFACINCGPDKGIPIMSSAKFSTVFC